MAFNLKIPLKYKFLGVLMCVMCVGFGIFFSLAYRTFSEDKKLFVMELNLSLLKTAMSDVKAELKGRLDELKVFIPRVYQVSNLGAAQGNPEDPFQGLNPDQLPDELIGITFYRKLPNENRFELIKQYKNQELIQARNLPATVLADIEKAKPINLTQYSFESGTELHNRSLIITSNGTPQEGPVLSIVIPGNFVNTDSKSVVIVVDLIQDFLRKKLQQSEIAEVFLVSKSGSLLSHGSQKELVKYAKEKFDHPIIERLQNKQFPRESFEVQIQNEAYLCNVAETGLPEIFAVSQIKQSEAFLALKTLMRQTLVTALFILSFALIFSVIFAGRLTANIQKLKIAAESIGRGEFRTHIDIRSNDEVESVAHSFKWMSNRISELIEESATKARMEDELETAKLVQSTLLTTPAINSEAVEIEGFYQSASECGGDVWDAFISHDILTVLIGDATGHGAPAAIVTAVAKSCYATLNSVYEGKPLVPEEFLEQLNKVIYSSCKGQLLMTMCVLQLDLRTGELLVCNAGHESPMCLRNDSDGTETPPNEKKKGTVEVLFSRGERLGFSPDAKYESIKEKLNIGDSVLLYTDGISEALNFEGKQFGERSLKKALAKGGMRPLPTIKAELVTGVHEFMGSAPQADDITFVLTSWKKALQNSALRPEHNARVLHSPAYNNAMALDLTQNAIEETVPETLGQADSQESTRSSNDSIDKPTPAISENFGQSLVDALRENSVSRQPKDLVEAETKTDLEITNPFHDEEVDGSFCDIPSEEYCELPVVEVCPLPEPKNPVQVEVHFPEPVQEPAIETNIIDAMEESIPVLEHVVTEQKIQFKDLNDAELVQEMIQEEAEWFPLASNKEEHTAKKRIEPVEDFNDWESIIGESPEIEIVPPTPKTKEIPKVPSGVNPNIFELAKSDKTSDELESRNYSRIEEIAKKDDGSSGNEAA